MTKKMFKSIVSVLLAVFMLIPLTMTSAYAAESIKLNKTSIAITEGKTSTLKVTGTSEKITWSSSDKKIATVSTKGVVTAKAVGTATITAKVGKTALTCKVTVNTNKILLAETSVSLSKGDTTSVTVKINGIDDIVCGTTDKTVATAKLNAKKTSVTITGVSKGTASIKIYSKSNKALARVIKVNVTAKVSTDTIVGKYKGDTYSNDYFNIKIDLSDYDFEKPDYYYNNTDYQYFLVSAEDENAVYDLTVYDLSKASKYVDGVTSNMTAKGFIDNMLSGALDEGQELEAMIALANETEGIAMKQSTATIAGQKYSTLYMAMEFGTLDLDLDLDLNIYMNVAAIKKDNQLLLIGVFSTKKGCYNEFISNISPLK